MCDSAPHDDVEDDAEIAHAVVDVVTCGCRLRGDRRLLTIVV